MARGSRQGSSKLSESQVRDIIIRVRNGEIKSKIAKEHGLHWTTIGLICAGKSWAHIHAEIDKERESNEP